MSFDRLVRAAALAAAMACAAPLAGAREPARGAPVVVDSVDVEQVAELGAGVPLVFTVFGTPQALATLRIDGARRLLQLHETEAGVYEGTYVVDARDAIGPESRVVASLQRQGAVASAPLDEPLLLAQGSVPWSVAGAEPPPPAEPLVSPSTAAPIGAPPPPIRAPTPVAIAAATPMPVPLAVAPARPVPPAPLRAAVPPPRERSRDGAPSPRESARALAPCGDCAVVESVRAVDIGPRGGVIGAVGGAIAGAILGKELGEAHNRRVLSVLGAIGGALLGREVERQATQSSTRYDVVLRLADGTLLQRRYEQAPPFVAGETIRLGASTAGAAPLRASF